ncbi:MAG: sulfatase-like hydrolase/transferase [Oligoflexales bacterium]
MTEEVGLSWKELRRYLLHLFTLTAFAIAQPVFSVLGKQSEFFLSNGTGAFDIVLLAFIVLALIPLVLSGLAVFARVVNRKLFFPVYYFGFVLLSALLVLSFINKFDLPSGGKIAISLIFGAGAAYLHWSQKSVREFLSFASVSVPAVGIFFFVSPSIRPILFAKGQVFASTADQQNKTPVVFVILDELPLVSLLRDDLSIDEARFPNFARVARMSHWFRNTSTVHVATASAVPAILTGNYPDRKKSPSYTSHPNNLFSLLGGSYHMHVVENTADLYPSERPESETWVQNSVILLADTGIIYGHIVLPKSLAKDLLPPVTQDWADFASLRPRSGKGNRVDQFREFVNVIRNGQSSEDPELHFIHLKLPHVPFELNEEVGFYYPNNLPGIDLEKEMWSDSEDLVFQGWQRHLIQLQAVDKLIGEMLDALEKRGILDDSLLVLTADHGVSFWPSRSRRYIRNNDHLAEILNVPLFVKLPGEKTPVVVDEPGQNIDILPTVATVLGVNLPFAVDGRSLLPLGSHVAAQRFSFDYPDFAKQEVQTQLADFIPLVKRKNALFPNPTFYDSEISSDLESLKGKTVADVRIIDRPSEMTVVLDKRGKSHFGTVRRVFGQVSGSVGNDPVTPVVVSVKNVISSVGYVYRSDTGEELSALIKEMPTPVELGDVKIFTVAHDAIGTALVPVQVKF